MKTRSILLGLAVIIVGCVRATWPRPVQPEDDRSITFPQFFNEPAIHVGADPTPYELDGMMLKAIMIATNDFLRPGAKEPTCWGSPEAHKYRVIRKDNVIFVRIDEDLEYCGLQYVSADTGAEYAISADGRILRRMIDSEPESSVAAPPTDAGVQEPATEPAGGASIQDAGVQGLDGGSPQPQ